MLSLCRELIVAEKVHRRVLVETHDLIQEFKAQIYPHILPQHDLEEILRQISDVLLFNTQAAVEHFSRLPKEINLRMTSAYQFKKPEEEHQLRAATFWMAFALYKRIKDELGGFESYKYPGQWPYLFDGLIGEDSLYKLIPYHGE